MLHQLDAAWLSRPWDEVRPPLHPFAPVETRVQKKGANVRPLNSVPRRASPFPQDRLDRISEGLFRGDERGERVSTAAVRRPTFITRSSPRRVTTNVGTTSTA